MGFCSTSRWCGSVSGTACLALPASLPFGKASMQETSCARCYPRVELLQSSSIQLIPQQNGDPTPPHNRSQKFPEHVGKLETLQEDVRVKKHQETVLMASPILRRRLAELWRGTPAKLSGWVIPGPGGFHYENKRTNNVEMQGMGRLHGFHLLEISWNRIC